ncbi:MAG: hypothetical protein WCD79_00265 [Chthoniobacteraceae bacterium]
MKIKKANYNISFAPPLAIKDEPHRTKDTVDGWQGATELEAEDFGQICEAGNQVEIETVELASVEVG